MSQFISGKSRNIQKVLGYLSKIVSSIFKIGTSCCGGRPTSSSFQGRFGLLGVFHTIFILYLNDLPSEALS